MLKLIEDEDSLKDDLGALNRLQLIVKEWQQLPDMTKLITDCLYRIKLPEQT